MYNLQLFRLRLKNLTINILFSELIFEESHKLHVRKKPEQTKLIESKGLLIIFIKQIAILKKHYRDQNLL